MNDRQVQDLIRGMFVNQMVFRIMDSAKAHRGNVQQGQEVQKMPIIIDIIGVCFLLFWIILLGGTMLLSLMGLFMLVFNID